MRVIIGCGNILRGEDAFGIDVLKELQKFDLKATKLLSVPTLFPELILKLLDADEIIFIDACHDTKNHYMLACNTVQENNLNLTHHISPQIIKALLNNLYNKYPKFQIYSMLTNSFDKVENIKNYNFNIKKVVDYLTYS